MHKCIKTYNNKKISAGTVPLKVNDPLVSFGKSKGLIHIYRCVIFFVNRLMEHNIIILIEEPTRLRKTMHRIQIIENIRTYKFRHNKLGMHKPHSFVLVSRCYFDTLYNKENLSVVVSYMHKLVNIKRHVEFADHFTLYTV